MTRETDRSPRAVHHALLNHIAVVSTYAHLLKDSPINQDQRDIIDELSSSIEDAHALAVDLGRQLAIHPGPDNDTAGGPT